MTALPLLYDKEATAKLFSRHAFSHSFLDVVLLPMSINALDSRSNASCILLYEFLSMSIVEGFRIVPILLNNPHFQFFGFEEFNIGCGSCLMASKGNFSCSSFSVGILACNSHGQVSRCRRIIDAAR